MKRLRGLVALLVLAGLVGGLPWALVKFGEWPFHEMPNASCLDRLTDTFVSDRAVFAVLTAAVWIVWAAFTCSVFVELVSVVRGIEAPHISLAGPIQRAASGLVATLVIAASINHATSAMAASALPTSAGPRPQHPTASLSLASTVRTIDAPVHRVPASAAPNEVANVMVAEVLTVSPGDTPWSLAERHLGDGMRWRELWDMNRTTEQPDGRLWSDPETVRPGWNLRLPMASAVVSGTHVVVEGDTLWDIAAAELGDGRRFPEIYNANQGVEQPDGEHLSNPDLILPSWRLTIPTDAASPIASTPPVFEDDAPPVAVTPVPSITPAPSTATPVATAPVVAVTSLSGSTSTLSWPPPATVRASPDAKPAGRSIELLAGLGGSLVLATGLGARIMVLRRRRLSRGGAAAPLSKRSADTATAVMRAGDMPLVQWAAHHISSLVANLPPGYVTGGPQAVELSVESGIEVLWDRQQPAAPSPWTTADGGWAWRLAYDEDAPTPDADLPAAMPALVTIGTRDGRQLLIDLEAFGTIAVSGPDDRVDAFLRSVALELAAGDDLADAYVYTVGVEVADVGLSRLQAVAADDAARHLASARRSVGESMRVVGFDNTFEARLGSTPPIEASVAIVGRGVEGGDAVEAAPRSSTAVVIASAKSNAPCRIKLANDGTARIEPLGIDFVLVGVTVETSTVINEALSELETIAAAPVDSVSPVEDAIEESPGTIVVREGEVPEEIETKADCLNPPILVKVLGVPRVPQRPNLGRRELIATVVLACHGKPISADLIQDALYGDEPIKPKTLWNVIASTRATLGEFDDGTAVMPETDRTRSQVGLDRRVVTDVGVLRSAERMARCDGSESLAALVAAHELIEGPPFDACGYTWAIDGRIADECAATIESATARVVELALDDGNVECARAAVRRGLRALPDCESIVRARIETELAAGSSASALAAYEELRTRLETLGTTPSPETTALLDMRHLKRKSA